MWIGDVGQNAMEEIDRGTGSGHNYGWRCYEGSSPFNTSGCPNQNELTFPVTEYPHDNSCNFFSVVGGYVYRGQDFPNMQGLYFFSDTCANNIRYINADTLGEVTLSESFDGNSFVSFGEDQNNELYIAGLTGTIYRVIDAQTLSTEDSVLSENKINIYPNPTTDMLTISFPNFSDIDTLTIYNISGKFVRSVPIQDKTTRISIKDLSSGIYLLQSKKRGFTQKLIVQ